MIQAGYLISVETDRWIAARAAADGIDRREILVDGEADPAQMAVGAATALAELGYRAGGVVLTLPSRLVLAAAINCSDLPRRDRRQAMVYRLEEQLPLEAEQVTADFLPSTAGEALAVAVRTTQIAPIVEAIEAAGITVTAICPAALLALWDILANNNDIIGIDYFVLTTTTSSTDVFRMDGGHPVAWYWSPGDHRQSVRSIQADSLASATPDRPRNIAVIGPQCGPLIGLLREDTSLVVTTRQDFDALAGAARSAAVMASGKKAGWVDLRRDGLAPQSPWAPLRPWVRTAAILAAVFLVVVTAAFQWRSLRYAAGAKKNLRDQTVLFQRLYPGQPVPLSIASRLRSEAARLSGLAGADSSLPRRISALETLRELVAALPEGLRFRLASIQIAPGTIVLEGQARAHGDAEAIATGLNRGGFAMEPPHSENLPSGGVDFTLAGKPLAAGQPAESVKQ